MPRIRRCKKGGAYSPLSAVCGESAVIDLVGFPVPQRADFYDYSSGLIHIRVGIVQLKI